MRDYLEWPRRWRLLYWGQCIAIGCALTHLVTYAIGYGH